MGIWRMMMNAERRLNEDLEAYFRPSVDDGVRPQRGQFQIVFRALRRAIVCMPVNLDLLQPIDTRPNDTRKRA